MKWLLLLCMGLVACSARHDAGNLVDGYQLLAMNPAELYVAKSDRELVLGPTIEKIGMQNEVIVVYCGMENRAVNGFTNTVGYNVIFAKTGEVVKGLNEQQLHDLLQARNVLPPQLEAPQKYFH